MKLLRNAKFHNAYICNIGFCMQAQKQVFCSQHKTCNLMYHNFMKNYLDFKDMKCQSPKFILSLFFHPQCIFKRVCVVIKNEPYNHLQKEYFCRSGTSIHNQVRVDLIVTLFLENFVYIIVVLQPQLGSHRSSFKSQGLVAPSQAVLSYPKIPELPNPLPYSRAEVFYVLAKNQTENTLLCKYIH